MSSDSSLHISRTSHQLTEIDIYVGLGSGLWRGAFDEFSLQLAIAVIQ